MRDYEARAKLTETEDELLDAIMEFEGFVRRTDTIRHLIREGAVQRGLLPGAETPSRAEVESELREAFRQLGLSHAAIEFALRGRQS
jgi:hypothetical protein